MEFLDKMKYLYKKGYNGEYVLVKKSRDAKELHEYLKVEIFQNNVPPSQIFITDNLNHHILEELLI